MTLPDVRFGDVDAAETDWRESDDIDEDEDELKTTPKDVVFMLGFDPAEEIRSWRTDAADSVAFDRASMRHTDKDGHLHVEMTPISKANVCEYTGGEINRVMDGSSGWESLEPNQLYRLYRDPEELKKAADSFASKPILLTHRPVNADDHPREITVGSIGDKVRFASPYLMAPLTIWDGEAIGLIESGEQKELSSGYRYRADMTPGKTADGEVYDGVMRDIVGNHVALVREGRAGHDVIVGDSAMRRMFDWARLFARDESERTKERNEGKLGERTREEIGRVGGTKREELPDSDFLEPARKKYPVKKDGKYDRGLLLAAAREARMHGHEELARRADAIRKREFGAAADTKESTMKNLLSRQAAFAQGVLFAYLKPKLAADAKIDLSRILGGMKAKSFSDGKQQLAVALKSAIKDKLAKDASIEDIEKVIDLIDEEKPDATDGRWTAEGFEEGGKFHPIRSAPEYSKSKAGDEEPEPQARLREFLKGKGMADDDIEAACDLLDEEGQEAIDQADEEKRKAEEEERKKREQEAKDEEKDDELAKRPTKAAMDTAIANAVKAERQRNADIREAEEAVRPYVGKLAIAHDSAEEVYCTALASMGKNAADLKDLPLKALKVILSGVPVPGSAPRQNAVAMDASNVSSFFELYPEAKETSVQML